MHTMNNNVKQCMNIMKSTVNTCSFCHKGLTSNANQQKKPIPWKNLTKIKFSQPLWWKSQPRAQNSPKHNLRIKINENIFYLRDVNGMKNHSNWLDFDVKILKKGFIRGCERFEIGFPWKSSLKTNIYDLPQENDYISLKLFIWLLYNS